jgi:hypothetical protein
MSDEDDVRRWLQEGAEPRQAVGGKSPKRGAEMSPADVARGREMARRRQKARQRRARRKE